jgi:ABC-type transporter Mla subunit MlaD
MTEAAAAPIEVKVRRQPTSSEGYSGAIVLELVVSDAASVTELAQYSNERERNEYALSALRIGLLSLKHARGQIDADAVQHEADRMLEKLASTLSEHRSTLHDGIAQCLREYFDPLSGKFNERVERLIKHDGDLEKLMRRQLSGDGSELSTTLAKHIGENSPLMRMINPEEAKGLVSSLRGAVEEVLEAERQAILGEFSLDKEGSALKRLVRHIENTTGQLKGDMDEKIAIVVNEFSLDNHDSALSRLVDRVDKAQRTITSEFSLDNENSALSRMSGLLKDASDSIDKNLTLDDSESALARLRKELIDTLKDAQEQAAGFQSDVKIALAEMKTKREEAFRTTTHGRTFEDEICALAEREAQRTGDIPFRTGSTTGSIRNCKKGDLVIELGCENTAAGAKFVMEAKEDGSYDFAAARAEIEMARKNREANIGIFVFSKRTAPSTMEPLFRQGDDIFVTWDAEDPSSDWVIKAAFAIAKGLCVKQQKVRAAEAQDFETIDNAILEVERLTNKLESIRTWTETVKLNSGKILDEVRKMQEGVAAQIERLRDSVAALRQSTTRA